MNKIKLLPLYLALSTSLFAMDTTLSNISFESDESGNLNPNIFIPFYYGSKNQFFSALSYKTTNYQITNVLDNFDESKSSFSSSRQALTINYFSYVKKMIGMEFTFGVESTFSKTSQVEFGYLHDKNQVFNQGTNYYVSFDNEVDLTQQNHSIRMNIVLPIGDSFNSRLSTVVSPLNMLKVKQDTIFKPLVSQNGSSSGTTMQDLSYNINYEAQYNTHYYFKLGFIANYNVQPLKYDLAQLNGNKNGFFFESTSIDSTEITKTVLGKIILDIDVLGGLNPSIGYGIKKLNIKDNISNQTTIVDKNIVTFGFEKKF